MDTGSRCLVHDIFLYSVAMMPNANSLVNLVSSAPCSGYLIRSVITSETTKRDHWPHLSGKRLPRSDDLAFIDLDLDDWIGVHV